MPAPESPRRVHDAAAAAGEVRDTSVGKALAVLDTLSGSRKSLGVSEIAARTGMAKSTVHRLLSAMIEHGYVAKEGERYLLAERVFELGSRVQVGAAKDLRELASPYLAELFALTRQTIHLAILSGADILYIDKVSGLGAPRMDTRIGGRRPAYATGLGKALLAFAPSPHLRAVLDGSFKRFTAYTIPDAQRMKLSLVRVRETGIATDHEESFLGVACLAAPIWAADHSRAVAAVSLSCPVLGRTPARYRSVLVDTAQQLSTALHRT
ncbi:IclR family transcriptional regulator [Streptomyces sp. CBMA29]|uniref:IclR family transcriptional regulator n=1 Tax=Streptomyces sp. CBMA29 TaxID=1896314 RepID=UPI001661FE56|nr:IclR family transcriptional regulator [Streptomyces sp. CBMA29]